MAGKLHWLLPGDDTTQCGLPVNHRYAFTDIQTVGSCVDTTCKSCLRTNPGSASKERAWHKKVGRAGETVCGIGSTWWRREDLNLTAKDPEVTCGSCLRCMKAARRRKRLEAA